MSYVIAGACILVTGGAGCLGSTIVEQLLGEQAARVDVLDDFSEGYMENLRPLQARTNFGAVIRGDLANGKFVADVIRDYDYIFHCGGHLLLKAQADGHAAIDTNIHGTLNVLEAALAAGVRKVVFTSSISIFGEPVYTPVDEKHPLNNTTIYGATKIAGEHLCREFFRRGLVTSIIRPANIYGPRQSPQNGAYSQVVPRWIRRVERGEPIIVHGDGSQTMDLVHVSDMARAHVLALASAAADGEAFNVATGVATSAANLAYQLITVMNQPGYPVQFVPHDVNLVKNRCVDITKAHELLGYQPQYPLAAGLRSTVDWWRAQQAAA